MADLRPNDLGEGTVNADLIVDAANGVGASKLLLLQKITPSLRLQVRNSGLVGEGLLNDGCGADFVQKEKVPPSGFESSSDKSNRCQTSISNSILQNFVCNSECVNNRHFLH